MEKNYLTETERMTLKHVLKFDNLTIDLFENFNLDSHTRSFIIFNMMVHLQQKEQQKKMNNIFSTRKKKNIFQKLFGKKS